MGNKLLLTTMVLLFLVSCSPKIAEIQSENITYSQFVSLLQSEDPRFYKKKDLVIEKELSDWKRLKSILTDYLNNKAIWIDLNINEFSKTISSNVKKLFYLYTISQFTFEKLKKNNKLRHFKKDKNKVIFYERVLEKPNNNSLTILEVKNMLTLTVGELKSILPKQANIKDFIKNNMLHKIYLSIEGKRLGLDEISSFKDMWKLNWKWRLIYLYKKKLINELTQKIIKKGEKPLKDYYKANKSKFGMYPKSTGKKQWYQLSYTRVRNSIIEHFVEKEFDKLNERLWEKYKISISKKYFKSFENNV